MPLPSELQRAQYLSSKLYGAISNAERAKREYVSFDIEYARELQQLLADSIRTAERMHGIVEYDGTAEPMRRDVVGRIEKRN